MIQSDLERLKKRLSQWVNKPNDINHRAMGALAYLANAGKAPSLDSWVRIIREIARPSHARATALAYTRDVSDKRGGMIAVTHDTITFTPAISDFACSLAWQLTDNEKGKILNLVDTSTDTGWSEQELLDAVKAYVEMQNNESSGKQFRKSNYYKSLAAKYGRTEKSFEYRMQNISFVLQNMGEKWLTGLKPAKNVGTHIAEKIEEFLLQEYREERHKIVAIIEDLLDDDIEDQKVIQRSEPATPQELQGSTSRQLNIVAGSQGKAIAKDGRLSKAALERAKYICQINPKHETFTTIRGVPYMEGHHLIPCTITNAEYFWEKDGKNIDCVENIVCICPNCHRAVHFGDESTRKTILKAMYDQQDKQLTLAGITITEEGLLALYTK